MQEVIANPVKSTLQRQICTSLTKISNVCKKILTCNDKEGFGIVLVQCEPCDNRNRNL
jgi:hypothetical protein